MLGLFSLQGEANRADWWIVTIVGVSVAQVALILALLEALKGADASWFGVVAGMVAGLAGIWTVIAVTVRRFRDRGESPWMVLVALIPIVGELWILLACGILPNPRRTRKRTIVRHVTRSA